MTYKLRRVKFTYYRLLFVVLMFSVGLICFAQLLIEAIYGTSKLTPELQSYHDAVIVGTVIVGVLSTMFGFIMSRLLVDRRSQMTDRRQDSISIDFPDRRSGVDRREASEAELELTS